MTRPPPHDTTTVGGSSKVGSVLTLTSGDKRRGRGGPSYLCYFRNAPTYTESTCSRKKARLSRSHISNHNFDGLSEPLIALLCQTSLEVGFVQGRLDHRKSRLYIYLKLLPASWPIKQCFVKECFGLESLNLLSPHFNCYIAHDRSVQWGFIAQNPFNLISSIPV